RDRSAQAQRKAGRQEQGEIDDRQQVRDRRRAAAEADEQRPQKEHDEDGHVDQPVNPGAQNPHRMSSSRRWMQDRRQPGEERVTLTPFRTRGTVDSCGGVYSQYGEML